MRFVAAFVVASGVFASEDCNADDVSALQKSTVSKQKSQRLELPTSGQCTPAFQNAMLYCLTGDLKASNDFVSTVQGGNVSTAVSNVLLNLENLDCPDLKARMHCMQQSPCWWTFLMGDFVAMKPMCDFVFESYVRDLAFEVLGTSTTLGQVCSQTPEDLFKLLSSPRGVFDQCGLSCDAPWPFQSGEACAKAAHLPLEACSEVASGMRKKFVRLNGHQRRLPKGCYNYNGAVYWNSWGKDRSNGGRKTNGRETVCDPLTTTTTTLWTLSGEACAGASLSKWDCVTAAKNRRQSLKLVNESYQMKRPGGCYRYKQSVWWNANATGPTKRGCKSLCLAEDKKLLTGDVCLKDNKVYTVYKPGDARLQLSSQKVPVLYTHTGPALGLQKQLGRKEHCDYAAQLVNKRQRLKMVPQGDQSRRPGGCHKYHGAVWWNPNATGATKEGRETVCFEATLNLTMTSDDA